MQVQGRYNLCKSSLSLVTHHRLCMKTGLHRLPWPSYPSASALLGLPHRNIEGPADLNAIRGGVTSSVHTCTSKHKAALMLLYRELWLTGIAELTAGV